MRALVFVASTVAILAALLPAFAGACDRGAVARVRMPAAQRCWTYRGVATTFVGDFSHGQTISVLMSGDEADYDPRSGRVATRTRPRDPNVEGPGGFFFGDAEAPGALTFVAPANGTYRFSFSPCSMWRAPGTVTICKK